jgi:hypothetical protein
MEKIFINIAKEEFCPDEIDTSIDPELVRIREEYDKKFNELVKWFWEEVDRQTTIEEKTILFRQLNEDFQNCIETRYSQLSK